MKTKILVFATMIGFNICAQSLDLYLKGIAEISLHHIDLALPCLDSALANKPDNLRYLLTRASVYFNLGRYDEAKNDFITANQIQQGAGMYGLARCYAITNQPTKCVEYLKIHLTSSFKLPQKEIKLDTAFEKIENSKEWKILWQQEWYNKYDYAASDAEFMIQNKEYTDAINLISGILRDHEKKHDLIALRARAYYSMGSYKNALNDLNDAIELRKKPDYYTWRGKTYVKLEQYQQAANDFSEVINKNLSNLELFLYRADALRNAKQPDEAIADVQTYLQYMGYSEQAYYILAQAEFDKTNYMDVLSSINKILEKNKSKYEYFTLRGNTYYKLNMMKYAIKDYAQALDINNKLAEVWESKGLARLALGDHNGACHDWQMAVSHGSNKAIEYLQQNCMK